jgi:hypothetical protein
MKLKSAYFCVCENHELNINYMSTSLNTEQFFSNSIQFRFNRKEILLPNRISELKLITLENFMTRTHVVRSGRVGSARGEGILTAIQRNATQILRKIPKSQVTLMSAITWGL